MTRAASQFSLLLVKDLRIESRSRQTLGLVIVLGLLIIVVLGLGLGATNNIAGFSATAVLWVRICSAACSASKKPWRWSETIRCWRDC
jgi:ABC-type transport system involved in cytochrome c biogenesis permease component